MWISGVVSWLMSTRRATLVWVPEYGPDAPLFWFLGQLLLGSGWPIAAVANSESVSLEGSDFVAAFGDACALAVPASALRLPGLWMSPSLADPDIAEALASNESPTLVVGSLADPAWDRMAAVRLRRAEVLQLTNADRLLQVPGDAFRSLEIVERILERASALIHRLA
jgi:hypothetical protein